MQPRRRPRGPRGLGQVMPTCASVDASQTIPQMVLLGGGSLAMLVGIIGAVASDEYRKEFAITAAAGLAANVVGGIWAASTFSQNFLSAQCTGPGMPSLGIASVNPDQTTPVGQQPSLLGPITSTSAPTSTQTQPTVQSSSATGLTSA